MQTNMKFFTSHGHQRWVYNRTRKQWRILLFIIIIKYISQHNKVTQNLKWGVLRGYTSGAHFEKCPKFSIIFSLYTSKGRGQAQGPPKYARAREPAENSYYVHLHRVSCIKKGQFVFARKLANA